MVRNWLVDPGIEIPGKAAEIHGITTEIAQAEGMSPAPVIAEICEELIRAADGQVPIVAFNACFDLTLLDRECRRNGTGPRCAYERSRASGAPQCSWPSQPFSSTRMM